MARARKTNRKPVDDEALKRPNSAAYRALRRRASQGKGAHAAVGDTPAELDTADAPVTDPLESPSAVQSDDTSQLDDAALLDEPAQLDNTSQLDDTALLDEPAQLDNTTQSNSAPAFIPSLEPLSDDDTEGVSLASEREVNEAAADDVDAARDSEEDSEPDSDVEAEPKPTTPGWLAAGVAATATAEHEVYVPKFDPAPVDMEDEPADEDQVALSGAAAEDQVSTDGVSTDDVSTDSEADRDDLALAPHAPAEPELALDDAVTEDDAVTDSHAATEDDDAVATDDTVSSDDTVTKDDAVTEDDTVVFAPIAETAVLSPVDPAAAPPAAPTAETPAWPQAAAPATASAPPYVASGQALPAHDPAPVAADGDESESADTSTSTPRRKAWLIPLVIVGFAVLYVGAQALVSSTVPRGTEAVGIDIGGMSAVQAQGEIDSRASELATAEIEMNAAEQSFALPAADAGLDIDAEATIAQVTGFTVMPDRLWAHITGGGELEPVIAVDDASLADALETAATQLDGPSQDAGVTVSDGAVEVVPGRSSITVDQQASAALIADVWPSSLTIDLIAEVTPPAITDEDAQTFARQLESQTFAAPITLIGDDAEATIEPATIATHSTVVAGPSGLMLEVDGEGLAGAIIESNPDLTTDGENASVSFDDNHKIVIDEGKPGITIDADELGTAVTAAAANLDRIGELPYTAADPEVSAEDLGLADFKEVVSTFDTPLTSEWVRTENLRVSAQAITGMVLQPGDNFDLVDALSPINEESGYRPSGVIVNGILTTGMGGGLSQMATTAFNVGYFAGYELIEHRPHSVWLTRYPAGRESTMYTGSINVVFKNNTPYAAIINSYVDGGRLYVDLWSTKHFDVTTAESPRSNVRQPGVKEVTSANCSAKSAGQPGFTITNTRTVTLEGDEFSKDSFTWTYKPDDAIRCVSPNTPDDDDDDED